MSGCSWDKITGFQSPGEFHGFEKWIAEQVARGDAEEVPVDKNFAKPYWSQRWFRHKASGEIWRLADLDPPFAGAFERVK